MALFMKVPLIPYILCVNSESSGDTAPMRRRASAFDISLCDKYPIFTNNGYFMSFSLHIL